MNARYLPKDRDVGGSTNRGRGGGPRRMLAAGVLSAVVALSSCAPRLSESEAFPGQAFSEGKNNMLDHAEDAARTEYTGERLGHRSKSGMVTTSGMTAARPAPDQDSEPERLMVDESLSRQVDQAAAMAGGGARIEPALLTSGDVELEDIRVEEMNLAAATPEPRKPSSAPGVKRSPKRDWQLGVFLASYRSDAVARKGWGKIKRQFSDELDGLRAEILEVDLGAKKGGEYHRLFAVSASLDAEGAAALCQILKSGGQFCRTALSGGRIQW